MLHIYIYDISRLRVKSSLNRYYVSSVCVFTFHDLGIFTCDNNVVDFIQSIFDYKCSPSYYRVPFRQPHLKLTFSCHILYIQIYCPPVHQSNLNKIRLPKTALRAQKSKIFQFSVERRLLLVESPFCHGSPGSISGVYLPSHLASLAR